MKICWHVLWVSLLISTRAVAQGAFERGPTNAVQLRVAGSSVIDSYGIFAGNIESAVVDPLSHQVLFALISTAYPSNRLTVTPVPWALLRHHADAREEVGIPGTFQQFKAPVERLTILRAPKVQLGERTNDFSWMAASSQYFQNAGANIGGIGAGGGTQTGGYASGNAAITPVYAGAENLPVYSGGYGGGFYGGGVVSPYDEYLLYGSLLFGPDFLTNVAGNTNAVFATNFLSSFSNYFATNATGTTNFFAANRSATNIFRPPHAVSNFFAGDVFSNVLSSNSITLFGTNLELLRSNFTAAFQTNPASIVRSNAFTLSPPNFPGTSGVPLNPRAVGAPGAGSGTVGSGPFTPFTPQQPQPNPQQPLPPAQITPPTEPVTPGTPVEQFPKRTLPTQPAPARPAAPSAPAPPRQ
jgi:hypothetical protein